MSKLLKHRSGQSLMETIFALGILLITVAGILALVMANSLGEKESEFQVIANNLAREGIEAVRNIRDTNWLSGREWSSGLVDPITGQNQALAVFDTNSGQWSLDFDYSDDVLYLSLKGLYSHDATGPGEKSIFHRHLILDNICRPQSGQENIDFPCALEEQKVGVRVMAIVNWQEKGRTRSVTLEDLIYDWK